MTMQTVHFKKQSGNRWRVTDSDGCRQVNADSAFALMQELVEDGWKLRMHVSRVDPRVVLSVTMERS